MFYTRSLFAIIALAMNIDTGRSMMFGKGGFGGFGGGFGGFKMSPPGPVFLPLVNASTRWGDIMEDIVLTTLDHCKSVRLCNTTDRYTHYDSDCSECHPCACEDTCYSRGDCCVDKLLNDLKDDLVMSSPRLEEAPVMGCHSTYITRNDFASHAFMVDTCLTSFHDDEIVSRCTRDSSNNTRDARWPVWSPASNAVYRDADCAVCNNEDIDQTVKWDLKIQCDRSIHLHDTASAEAVIEQIFTEPSCQASFTPPESCQPFACRPQQEHYIDTCNATGRRLDFDQALWKACELFHGEMTLEDITYKNVFCALCNEEEVEAVGQCQQELAFRFFVVLNVSSFQPSSSSAVVGGDGNGDDESAAGEGCSCLDDEIYDTFEMECRKLHCSMTRTLHNRHCHSFVTNSTGLAFEVTITLTPSASNSSVHLDEISSLKQVARNIRTAFLLQGSTASGWDVQVDHFRVIAQAQRDNARPEPEKELNVTCFKVDIKFASIWSEPAEDLESRLFALTHSLWNVSIDGKPKQSFRAAPLYISERQGNKTTLFANVGLYTSDSTTVEYAIDIPDRIIQGFVTEVLEADSYLPVTEVLKCAKVYFNISKETDVDNNDNVPLRINETSGTAFHVPSNRFISLEFFQVDDDGAVAVCAEKLYGQLDVVVVNPTALGSTFSSQLGAVAVVCQAGTGLFLVLVLLTLCLFPELRTLGGKTTMGFVATLLLAVLLLEVGMHMKKMPSLCVLFGIGTHFFLLSAFTWVLVCTFHAFRVARHVFAASNPDECENKSRLYAKHVAVSFSIPSAVVVVTLLGNFVGNPNNCFLDLGYGRGICFVSNRWSLGLAAIFPICLVLLVTLLLYVIAARGNPADVTRERKASSRRHFCHFVMHVGIVGLMGLTWLVGIFGFLVDVEILRYGFLALCPLLGVAVFLAFVCNKRVLALYQARFFSRCLKKRYDKHSQKFAPIDT